MMALREATCKPKVSNFYGVIFNENVCRLEIPVNEIILMNMLHSTKNLFKEIEVLLSVNHTIFIIEVILEASPRAILHLYH